MEREFGPLLRSIYKNVTSIF